MRVAFNPDLEYTGIFTFGEILDNAATFRTLSGQNAAIVHTHVDWSFGGTLTDFGTVNPIMGSSVADMAQQLARDGSLLALSWDRCRSTSSPRMSMPRPAPP